MKFCHLWVTELNGHLVQCLDNDAKDRQEIIHWLTLIKCYAHGNRMIPWPTDWEFKILRLNQSLDDSAIVGNGHRYKRWHAAYPILIAIVYGKKQQSYIFAAPYWHDSNQLLPGLWF